MSSLLNKSTICHANQPRFCSKKLHSGSSLHQRHSPQHHQVIKSTCCLASKGGEHAAADRRAVILAPALWTAATALSLNPLAHIGPAKAAQGITTVFVAGATGATGSRVVQQLRAAGYQVRAGVRDVAKAQKKGLADGDKLAVVKADLTAGVGALEAAIGDAQAVVCCIGAGGGFSSSKVGAVEEDGVKALVDAAKARGVQKFVIMTSLLTNAVAAGQGGNGTYKFLNFFGKTLDHKLAAEKHLRASGLNYTIVRPGGLSEKTPAEVGNLIVSSEDTLFALDKDPGRAISRDTVAAVMVAALSQPAADNKVFEIVASPAAPSKPVEQWFS